jgi:hypothetical protein
MNPFTLDPKSGEADPRARRAAPAGRARALAPRAWAAPAFAGGMPGKGRARSGDGGGTPSRTRSRSPSPSPSPSRSDHRTSAPPSSPPESRRALPPRHPDGAGRHRRLPVGAPCFGGGFEAFLWGGRASGPSPRTPANPPRLPRLPPPLPPATALSGARWSSPCPLAAPSPRRRPTWRAWTRPRVGAGGAGREGHGTMGARCQGAGPLGVTGRRAHAVGVLRWGTPQNPLSPLNSPSTHPPPNAPP